MTYPRNLLKQAIENDIAQKKYNPMNDALHYHQYPAL